jgi:hypothetical protein
VIHIELIYTRHLGLSVKIQRVTIRRNPICHGYVKTSDFESKEHMECQLRRASSVQLRPGAVTNTMDACAPVLTKVGISTIVTILTHRSAPVPIGNSMLGRMPRKDPAVF